MVKTLRVEKVHFDNWSLLYLVASTVWHLHVSTKSHNQSDKPLIYPGRPEWRPTPWPIRCLAHGPNGLQASSDVKWVRRREDNGRPCSHDSSRDFWGWGWDDIHHTAVDPGLPAAPSWGKSTPVLSVKLTSAAVVFTESPFQCVHGVRYLHPQVQKRIQKELDEQVGRERPVSVSDRSRLPYLDCVINEGMRIRPVSPVLIPHTARTNSRFSSLVPQKVVTGCVQKMYSVVQKFAVSISMLLYKLLHPLVLFFSTHHFKMLSGFPKQDYHPKKKIIKFFNLSSSIGGHSVQPGTRVLVNMWSIHHDPKQWDKPDLFNPGTTPPTTSRNLSIWSASNQAATFFFIPLQIALLTTRASESPPPASCHLGQDLESVLANHWPDWSSSSSCHRCYSGWVSVCREMLRCPVYRDGLASCYSHCLSMLLCCHE